LPTDTPAATSTPLPTETLTPTETPTPTATPVPVVIPINTIAPTAEPTEGPTFSLDYYRLEVCSPNWVPAIKIVNTGVTTISSYTIATKDRDTNTTLTTSSNDFSKRSGCTVVNDISSVDPGKTGYIYAPNFDYDPTGHSLKATITACFKNDLKGKCSTQVINFTP
jgi:hypothetical protein